MPELPEVEVLRRELDRTVRGHTMTGWWEFHRPSSPRGRAAETAPAAPAAELAPPPHVHARIAFRDGSELWFEDARRFGLLRPVRRSELARDPGLAILGADPLASPLSGAALAGRARGRRVSVKNLLLDQKWLAGIGNIYASEILYHARVDPRRRAGTVTRVEWRRVAASIRTVLRRAIDHLDALSRRRRLVGAASDPFRVYGRAGAPCARCRTPIRRIVQGQRATFFCPGCQRRRL